MTWIMETVGSCVALRASPAVVLLVYFVPGRLGFKKQRPLGCFLLRQKGACRAPPPPGRVSLFWIPIFCTPNSIDKVNYS